MICKTMLIIGFTWPEPNATAAGSRMLQLISFFLDEGYAITFASTSKPTDFSLNLEALGVKRETIELNHPSFDSFIKGLLPDIVLFDRFLTEEQFGWRVAESTPNAVRILDTEDLHSLRYARKKAFKAGIKFDLDFWLRQEITKREMASIYRCDLSLIISSYEMKLLEQVVAVPGALLLHLPFMIETPSAFTTDSWPCFGQRQHFMFIGTGKHEPNLDAIVWLKQEIWPCIREALPKEELHIYGSYLPKLITELHQPGEGFYVKGKLSNIEAAMRRHRVNLAPLRFGAGIKGKLIDSMRYGMPSVTTGIGAEGMHSDLPWNGSIAESASDFAKAAIALHTNQFEWDKAQQHGIEILRSCYDARRQRQVLRNKIHSLSRGLKKHRFKNFTGAMLGHHSLQSSKYLSKWIEAKNRGVKNN
ncbi:glycosyltransferase [Flavobacteriaceae bacterium TP-CH-4]|uniref:Glycosyltransferase n=1 Tax=Pelagihabitans pacificus TaxID=2696054 RepID=A0A967ATS0_9FLAO|nr:glycosyltransferase family 4 protein [Pelagihabitans pacificus]NHF59859.1 glycosyltransferase [Pelagihabitans pacificus]